MVGSRHHGRSDLKLAFIGICSVDAVVARGSTVRGRSGFMLRSIGQVATSMFIHQSTCFTSSV